MQLWNKIFLISVLTLICFSTSTGYAQHIPQGEPSLEIREMSRETAAMWTRELGLTEKQEILMEKELIAYAMKKEELLQSKMQEEAKAIRLLALQQEENGAMRNILTKPQYERYVVLQQKLLDEKLKNRKNQ
ncbi:MAG: hypothetical protein R6U03_08800 [Gillisia sp.]